MHDDLTGCAALRRRSAVCLVCAAVMLPLVGCAAPLERYEFQHRQMGTYFRLVLYAEDEATAAAASKAAFERVDELNRIMSDYYRPSELNKLSKTAGTGQRMRVSRDLWQVLRMAEQVSKLSDGAFDVTVGPVVKLWREARRSGRMPDKDELAAALSSIGYAGVRLTPPDEVELRHPGMQLDLGGIAKGYAGDAALFELRKRGVTRAMIDAGGDIVVGDAPPGKEGWQIGIAPLDADAPPSRYVVLSNAAIATSGDAWQYVEIDGKRYSHIVDPTTGLGLTQRSSVTVVVWGKSSPMWVGVNEAHVHGGYADALASAVSVMGPVRGIELMDSLFTPAAVDPASAVRPWYYDLRAAAIVVREFGGEPQTFESKMVKQLHVESIEEVEDADTSR